MKTITKYLITLAILLNGHGYAAEAFDDTTESDKQTQANICITRYNANLDNQGLIELLPTIQTNTTCKHIFLLKNNIGNKGFKALIDILPSTSVSSLTIANNHITDKGTKYFCRSPYAQNDDSSLQFFNCKKNPLTEKSRARLAQLMILKPTLEVKSSWGKNLSKKTLTKMGASTQTINFILTNTCFDDEQCINFIKRLLKLGVNINEQCPAGYTPLHWAAQLTNRGIEVLQLLCQANPDLSLRANNRTPLDLACEYEGTAAKINVLLEYLENQQRS